MKGARDITSSLGKTSAKPFAPQKPRNKDTGEWEEIGHMVRVRKACKSTAERRTPYEGSGSQTSCSEKEACQRLSSKRAASDSDH